MKGSIRMFVGATMIFGGVGSVETSTVAGIAPLMWIIAGVLIVYLAIQDMRG